MKKRILFAALFISILIVMVSLFSLVAAQDANESDSDTALADSSQDKIDNAYSCLESKVTGKCATLSPEERFFTLMAIGKCKDEVLADSVGNQYWTSATPSIKMTAQAILALDKATTTNTQPAQNWLLTQQGSPEDVDWYLQIESTQETTCTVSYDGLSHTLELSEDKTLSTGAGSCLTLSNDDYWLKITPGCYDREFEVSCDEDFLTALLFKRKTSSVIHISDITNSASAGGRTTEKVNSACFLEGGECNYEGTLWAALVLGYKGHDTAAYLPYLTTMADENSKFLPESFLYILTGSSDYRTDLLSKQINNKYWDTYKDKFYDTAIALYSISDDPPEKTNAKNWLLDPQVQGTDGCWQGNVRNTALILASIWPRQVDVVKTSCEGAGYYCMSDVSCVGSILNDYSCPGVLKCCDTAKPILSCSEQTGEICKVDETCAGGSVVEASDTATGETCCIGGTCEVPAAESECETYGGVCRPFECSAGEEEGFYACEFGDMCCIPSTKVEKKGGWGWIILLIILILLTVLGIVFRKKLKALWNKIRKKGPGPGKPGAPIGFGQGPGGPGRPGRPGMPGMRRPPRRILPPSQRSSARPAPAGKKPGQVDNVLKKLKGMTK